MKIATVSFSSTFGGASRAAFRNHLAIRSVGVDSVMVTADSAGAAAEGVPATLPRSLRYKQAVKRQINARLTATLRRRNPVLHSLAMPGGSILGQISGAQAEATHLHWINGEILSIEDLQRIEGPVLWTLHDLWPVMGAEHYPLDDKEMEQYKSPGAPIRSLLNRLTWQRKRRAWKRPFTLIAPSHWMAKMCAESPLFESWPVHVIPNAIDTSSWKPIAKQTAREILNLPMDGNLLIFGGLGGAADPRKGFDLALLSLARLRDRRDLRLLVFGAKPEHIPETGLPIQFTGHLHDDISLNLAYSAADATLIPSRLDNLPNVAVESVACGTPVVAYRVGGLMDVVDHQVNGYLAHPYDADDFAAGIRSVIDPGRQPAFRAAARASAIDRFSYERVGRAHRELYASVVS